MRNNAIDPAKTEETWLSERFFMPIKPSKDIVRTKNIKIKDCLAGRLFGK
jgi:hypothetical protein